MPISDKIPRAGFAEAQALVAAALDANIVPLLIGDPGVGKSALARQCADHFRAAHGGEHEALETLIGSTLDPTDVGGLPVVLAGKQLDRIPLGLIQRCCERPSLLFVDELSSAPGPVQAALLRLILERVAGDMRLHPGTRIMAATNPEEQTPAGAPLSAPLVGRVMMIHLRPSEKEVAAWFGTLGPEGSRLREEALDFSLTCGVMPDLLQVEIPGDCVTGNEPWGAPRAWERAVRVRASLAEVGADEDVMRQATEANVGRHKAAAYAGVLRMRKDLPTVDQIIADPAEARVPREREKQVAAIGLVPRVANEDTWAAWVYASRLDQEIQAACGKHLQARPDTPKEKSKHVKLGLKARVDVAGLMAGVKR